MDKFFRLILAGIVAGFVLFLVATLAYKYNNQLSDPSLRYLFRENISMKWFYKLLFLNIGMGMVMAVFYSVITNGLPGNGVVKGIFMGFMIWFLLITQPLITLILAGTLTQGLLVSWLAQGLVSYVAAGICISVVYKA
ncbi:MAG TPA: hypothetical protein PK247_02015 [Candidatus Goldiibacteriota bacterium]|nr:hypothetical protein [Candidatus Goldiibacteriota bacterium]HPI02487.1 hypothetical protein [Candidatus Goldiibacteriota bacterium]HPN63960.1 hypothetical protein [Candidatus Goldiibacteriota bacterium]